MSKIPAASQNIARVMIRRKFSVGSLVSLCILELVLDIVRQNQRRCHMHLFELADHL